MNCRNFHKSLEDYLDGGLDFAGRFGMERHAEQCFVCGKELADAHKLRQLTASITRVKAPVDFEARLRAEIARRKSQGLFARLRNRLDYGFAWPTMFSWPRLASAAAICAVLAIGVSSVRYLQREMPAASPDVPVMGQAAETVKPAATANAVKSVESAATAESVTAVTAAESMTPTPAVASPISPDPAVTEQAAAQTGTTAFVSVAMPPAAPVTIHPEPVGAFQATASAPAASRLYATFTPEPVSALQATVTEASELPSGLSGARKRARMEAVDLLLLGPESLPTSERLPRKIYVRYGPPSEEYFIMNVSH